MNRRSMLPCLLLVLCAATVGGAMLWLTHSIREASLARWHADCERTAAEARADLEQRTRLALWRMDALGAAIVLDEENQCDLLFADATTPALTHSTKVLLYFQVVNGKPPSTPQAAAQLSRKQRDLLAKLEQHLATYPIAFADPPNSLDSTTATGTRKVAPPKQKILPTPSALATDNAHRRRSEPADQLRRDPAYQSETNLNEKAVREQTLAPQARNRGTPVIPAAPSTRQNQLNGKPAAVQAPPAAQIDTQADQAVDPVIHRRQVGPLRAHWSGGGELFLVRRADLLQADGRIIEQTLQGCWLDAEALRQDLLGSVADLFANARLNPTSSSATNDPLALVSLPFTLAPGESLAVSMPPRPRLGLPLVLAWVGVAIAFLTTTALIIGLIRLSERRASFVSAVTHELRTPLTTFRLYSDLLEQDPLPPEKRGQYLNVLSREADRLTHLVENVLAFSRIERGSARTRFTTTSVDAFLQSQHERLASRLATAGLKLVIHPAPELELHTDLSALEHILFNLIDNAAKYAADSDPPEVEISARSTGRQLIIEVADHGPGIPAHERTRIFRPFHKSADQAANSQPGVGLGLALSRRLAHSLGGTLTLAPPIAPGNRFHLHLPLLH